MNTTPRNTQLACRLDWLLVLAGAVLFATQTSTLSAALVVLVGGGFGIAVAYYRGMSDAHRRKPRCPVHGPSAYEACGLGPMPADSLGSELYLDMVKRSVTNIIYEDEPEFYYEFNRHVRAQGFNLQRRVAGMDSPTIAHTMVGKRRLDNLQACIETALREEIQGDVLEAGVRCGGASIFARAVLKACGNADRRVIACDTFSRQADPPPVCLKLLTAPVLWMSASIPSRWWKRKLCSFVMRRQRSFPQAEDPSDQLVDFVMQLMKRPRWTAQSPTALDNVISHFARYGLLDEQVIFVPGLFADSLPAAGIEQLSVLRLDGDTYESTLDVLNSMYPKLSPGGFCIIDDFCIPDCRRAVETYRAQHGISDSISIIDQAGAYWRKSCAASAILSTSRADGPHSQTRRHVGWTTSPNG